MKIIAVALLATSAAMLSAQSPAPSLPNPGQLFQLPPALSGQSPQFKLQMRDRNLALPFSPHVFNVQPQTPGPNTAIDPAIVMHPWEGSFAQHPARPAMPQKLYPGLKIQPTEMAGLAPLPTLWPNAKVIPIPITWPHAKVIPIPTTADNFKALPIKSAGAPR